MILATVGTQLPFPRLVRALDRLAGAHALRIVAQTCGDLPGARSIEQHAFLAPDRLAALLREAKVIVGHAGIGTIFAAGRAGKPLVLFPRRAGLGEHRNDHQLATATAMQSRPGIHVAWDDDDLARLLLAPDLEPYVPRAAPDLPPLIEEIRALVQGDPAIPPSRETN